MRSSLHSFLLLITDIGDSACLIALTLAASIYLFSRHSRRAASFLITTLLVTALLIGMLKLLFIGCHNRFHSFGIHSPSGHAATSAAVFWACAILMRSQLEAKRRFLPLAVLTSLIILIAVSRVYLEAHNTMEVVAGIATGFISLLISRFFVLRHKTLVPFDAYAFALWCVIAVILAHGFHLPAEEWLRTLAGHIHKHVSFCGSGV